jgi:hypothetical protein
MSAPIVAPNALLRSDVVVGTGRQGVGSVSVAPRGYDYVRIIEPPAVVKHREFEDRLHAGLDAPGIGKRELVAGARRSSMDEPAAWTIEADEVLVF